ncbi:MAG: SGNH/GDSL hydrolase family protein [Coriobacteriia bacterium]
MQPFLIAGVLLVLLDLLLRTPMFPAFPDHYRTPRATSTAVQEFVTWQAQRDGVRVAVVGDSVTQGYLMWRDQTYVARADDLYEAEGRAVNVHNLGLTAARGTDLARVIEQIVEQDAADLIVVQFDYVFYSDGATETARFPTLFTASPSVEASPGIERDLRTLVQRSWKLVESREWIAAALLDGSPAAALRARLDARDDVLYVGGPRPSRLAYDRINIEMLENTWRVPEFTDANLQVAAVRRGLNAAGDAGIPVVLFMAPLNRDLGDYHGLYDDAVFRKNAGYIADLAADAGARFVDLSDVVPPEHMIDSVHMLPSGHEDLASELVRVIEPEVARAESHRGGR